MFAGGRGGQAGSGRRQRSAAGQDWTPGEEEEGVVHLARSIHHICSLVILLLQIKMFNSTSYHQAVCIFNVSSLFSEGLYEVL